MANYAVDVAIGQGTFTPEQKNSMTPTDWADIISSRWFSHAVQSLALTDIGSYENVGSSEEDYRKGAFVAQLKKHRTVPEDDEGFTYKEYTSEGMTYAGITPTKLTIAALRSAMKEADSSGCPVARKNAVIPKEMLEPMDSTQQPNPHLLNLLHAGILRIAPPEPGDEGKATIRVTQDNTAIDRLLGVFADQLRQYDRDFGTPQPAVVVDQNAYGDTRLGFTNARRQPVGALHWLPSETELASVV